MSKTASSVTRKSTDTHDTANTRERGYAKGRAKRQEIIEAATAVFSEAGYNRSSIQEIASRCSLTRAGLAHYFPNKKSILQAVLAWRDETEMAGFRARGSARGGLYVLREMVNLVRTNETMPGMVSLYTMLSAEATAPHHPAHAYFAARYQRLVAGTEWAIKQAQTAGDIRPGDAHSLAVSLMALMDGLQLQWLLGGYRLDMAAVLEAAIESTLMPTANWRIDPE
ncbi:MAG: TetR/AcrR family transcriptional regulator [Propionibacteriaceae bacterium]|jgi:AcrR family transcriptional regulator|nr:TetR/AcrR family transcriptional regulator [Propionibacteriaceae bacterium]